MKEYDELLEAAFKIIVEKNLAGTSLIQRHLKLGYNRASIIMRQLEDLGLVGKGGMAMPREILVDLNEGLSIIENKR